MGSDDPTTTTPLVKGSMAHMVLWVHGNVAVVTHIRRGCTASNADDSDNYTAVTK